MMTVTELTDKFGGTGETAKIFGVKSSAVSNWRTWNRFPPRLHLRVLREAEGRGIELPADFFPRTVAAE